MGELDRVTDEVAAAGLAEELFAVVDAIDASPALKRALTDVTTDEDARVALARGLFGGKVSKATATVLGEAVRRRWGGANALGAALERQAVRAALREALGAGTLGTVEEELFRLGRLVDASPELRSAIGDRNAPLVGRQALVTELIKGKVAHVSEGLARRAVAARQRTFDLTLDSYLALAAALRQHAIAHVTVAQPLSEKQANALRAALTKQLGREVTLQVVVDPEVLGGVRVRIGDDVIEGTVAGRIEDVTRQLG